MIILCSTDKNIQNRWRGALRTHAPLRTVADTKALTELLETGSDLVLLDLAQSEAKKYAETLQLLQRYAHIPFVMFSGLPSEQEGLTLIKAGAKGYCNRYITPEQLRNVVAVVRAGQVWVGQRLMLHLVQELGVQSKRQADALSHDRFIDLTDREREIARLVSTGASNKKIAQILEITERTVKAHISSIFYKVGISDRLQLALLVAEYQKT